MKQWRCVGAMGTRKGNQSLAWGVRYTTEGGGLEQSTEGCWGLIFFQRDLYSSWGRKVGQMTGVEGHRPPGVSLWTGCGPSDVQGGSGYPQCWFGFTKKTSK